MEEYFKNITTLGKVEGIVVDNFKKWHLLPIAVSCKATVNSICKCNGTL